MTIVSVVGARPQFIKAAVVSHAVRAVGIREILVHTGQHYDRSMSGVFFDELGIPEPDVNLGIGSGTHAVQTGAMMSAIETLLMEGDRPDCVLVYGDTNSTLAAALVASKLHIPLAHVEAGLRSFNKRMPEEINRIVTDRLSNILFCPTPTAIEHLKNEGMEDGVFLSGDVMLDATLFYSDRADGQVSLSDLTDLEPGGYHIATIHRAENADVPARLEGILKGLGRLDRPVLLPAHPRVKDRLEAGNLPSNVFLREPASYLELLTLVKNADRVLTDSGGLQKEAVWLGKPCVTFREETEWLESLEGGWNQVVGASADALVEAVSRNPVGPPPKFGRPATGESASESIAKTLLEQVKS